MPPSLNLPALVPDLTATRVGNHVDLHWSTPARTTDGKAIAGPITARICRDSYVNPLDAPIAPVPAAKTTAKPTVAASTIISLLPPAPPCYPQISIPVTPGQSDAVDPLPPALTSGPAVLLGYRIELHNAAGRTAGPTAPSFAAAGATPDPVALLRGSPIKPGALLEWAPETGAHPDFSIELNRTTLEKAPPSLTALAKAPKSATPRASQSELIAKPGSKPAAKPVSAPAADPTEARLRAGAGASTGVDAGGTLDRTVEIGARYRYTAQRVRIVTLGAHTLELRSATSAPITVAMLDVFPPDAPTGLIAVPGFADGVAAQPQRPSIDLSWQPDTEPRLAGYRIYRQEVVGELSQSAGTRLTDAPVTAPSYRDLTVISGHRYLYKITAVDTTGNESSPSDAAVEAAP